MPGITLSFFFQTIYCHNAILKEFHINSESFTYYTFILCNLCIIIYNVKLLSFIIIYYLLLIRNKMIK